MIADLCRPARDGAGDAFQERALEHRAVVELGHAEADALGAGFADEAGVAADSQEKCLDRINKIYRIG